ncbi:hypothetical protein GGI13_003679 [Coemansia sp. RSA 455]|nr:hypothetical protein LPJ71_003694 [Coemansia sp. S17]KAJ2020207.1 hypothetical protein GGI14_000996 [Coemansia sp. S680]KAJ2035132.1 hypothetical protein H4S03_004518 [Coemansia sp. S3946]KAJ2046584.1 hypothetical protein H4S04_004955 [Coemansia sp. S16]KAJ2097127.1 hypothetical protein GGI16_004652 [Coemansia sp. S142-1]KAJ2103451.1 hypothetical protein GGI09_000653 [Coemansia sp. S100]KAJ2112011.1 hypothetical protein IW146_004940 [Coemansia sp. RSA 922]KAJ2251743.1 hypothetical protein
MPFTFHTHSGQFCRHASGDLESVVQTAISKRMIVLGLSEHIPRSRHQDLYPEESDMTTHDLHKVFGDYVAEARRLRDKYSDQIEILIGAETEYITSTTLEEVKHLQSKYSLDYLVGSLHHIDEMPLDFSQEKYEQLVDHFNGDRAAMFSRYFDQQLELLQVLQPTVIGHFDLVRIFHPQTLQDPLALAEVRERASRNIDYAISYGAIFEVNSRAWKKGLKDAYPQRDLLREILDKGGRITISDDSHGAGDVCLYYDRLLGYLQELDVHDLYYLSRVDGRVQALKMESATEHEFWSANGLT